MDTFILISIIGIAAIVIVLLVLKQQSRSLERFPDPVQVVSREQYQTTVTQNEMLRLELTAKEMELRDFQGQIAAREQDIIHLEDRLFAQKTELQQIQTQFKVEFENIANRLLEEKSKKFTEQNSQHLNTVLTPLREKIKEFEENVDRKFMEETREKASLKKEIEQLFELNQQLSTDAHNLTSALKGQSKVQGDWGEYQLEMLLEKAGLQRGTHFLTQHSLRTEDGILKRPDFIVQLPDNKQLIVDAKVSLTAFERYHNDPDISKKEQHLKSHLISIRSHIDNLSKTNYQTLYQINTPDYLLLFIPLENALSTATQADPKLFSDALERNIVLVTTTSLIATMRTVAHLWKQEKQNRSVLEIARQSGYLYDKFVTFVEDLKAIGARLNQAQSAYDDAMNKLTDASRPGDTLIGKAEKIRELGARTTKSLPVDLVE